MGPSTFEPSAIFGPTDNKEGLDNRNAEIIFWENLKERRFNLVPVRQPPGPLGFAGKYRGSLTLDASASPVVFSSGSNGDVTEAKC